MAVVFLNPTPNLSNGFDTEAQYQMVPTGGVRSVALWVQADEPEDVLVYCSNPNHAYLFGLYAVQGHAVIRGSGYFVKRNSAIRFFVGGRDPGPTTLVVESASGKMRGFLLLSVKPLLKQTYQLAVISDPIHVPDKAGVGQNLAINMLGAAQLWMEQANISLERVGPINDVVVPMNLRDPITIDDRATYDAIIKATYASHPVVANFFVYGTWDIVYSNNSNIGGSHTDRLCFVENQFSGQFGALICAHEIGHALGLDHSEGSPPRLMTGLGINNDFLDMRDIETANPF
jgi:hypothetical protein